MSQKVKINNRWELELPDSSAQECLGNMKYHGDKWELPRLLKLEKFIKSKPGCIVMYIGAYKGDMAALCASWGAKMMLVESTPAFWGLIKETWELNPILPEPLVCFSGLISRETKNLDQTDFGWPKRTAEYIEGQVGFTHLAESKNDPTFPQITIDELVKQTGHQPDLITIDVEGSELEALYGAVEAITTYKPAFLLSVHPEFMFHNHGTYERELHDLLQNNKYRGEWLDYDHEHHWFYSEEKK